MNLFNFGKEKISKSVNKEIEDQEKEFGSLPDVEIQKQRELLKKLTTISSEEFNSNEIKITKESEEDKNKKIQEVLESINKSNI